MDGCGSNSVYKSFPYDIECFPNFSRYEPSQASWDDWEARDTLHLDWA